MSDITDDLLSAALVCREHGMDRTANEFAKTAEEVAALESQLAETKRLTGALVEAVKALPVEEWVEPRTVMGPDGQPDVEPELLGYVMQAQGEWDAVRRAVAALDTGITGDTFIELEELTGIPDGVTVEYPPDRKYLIHVGCNSYSTDDDETARGIIDLLRDQATLESQLAERETELNSYQVALHEMEHLAGELRDRLLEREREVSELREAVLRHKDANIKQDDEAESDAMDTLYELVEQRTLEAEDE